MICNNNGINTYARTESGHIYTCEECSMIHIIYKSIVLALDEFEFNCLVECVDQIQEEHFDFLHPQGFAATITFQKLQDGFLCIVEKDLLEFQNLLAEAYLIAKVHSLI